MSNEQLQAEDSPKRTDEKHLYCPSAQPQLNGSLIVGVIRDKGDRKEVKMLPHPVKVTGGTLTAFANSPVPATDVFRFAARCEENECKHWSGASCNIAERLVQIMPMATPALPECKLRSICRWFDQEGGASCFRCTQVLTHDPNAIESLVHFEPLNAGDSSNTTHL